MSHVQLRIVIKILFYDKCALFSVMTEPQSCLLGVVMWLTLCIFTIANNENSKEILQRSGECGSMRLQSHNGQGTNNHNTYSFLNTRNYMLIILDNDR